MAAAFSGNENAISYLLSLEDFQKCINYQDSKFGRTALHIATINVKVEAIKILLKYKANYHLRDRNGKTALHEAIKKNSQNVIKLLLKPLLLEIFGAEIEITELDAAKANQLFSLKKVRNTVNLSNLKLNEPLLSFYFMKFLLSRRSKITSINVSGNQLTRIPAKFRALMQLTELNAERNNFSSFPLNLVEMITLQKINLSHNKLGSFPRSFTQLQNLKELVLSETHLTEIPEVIFEMVSITSLDLSHNELSVLPSPLVKLLQLEFLNLEYNKFCRIPEIVRLLPSNMKLLLNHNPIYHSYEKKLLQQGHFDAIIGYLTDLTSSKINWPEVKVLILGQENVGKTCLARALQNKKRNRFEISTDGIDFGSIKKDSIELKLWDFAGQDLFYSTHSFYLSKSGIYLAVWNINDPSSLSKVKYWIHTINSSFKTEFDADSSLMIVGVATHVNSQSAIEVFNSQKQYLSHFHNIKNFIGVDSFSNYNIEVLLDLLFDYAKNVIRQEEVPKNYLIIAEILENLNSEIRAKRQIPVIKFNDLTTLTDMKSDQITRALSFLHSVGRIIYFNYSGINDVIILDCNWLNKAMITIITHKYQITKSDGIISALQLRDIWAQSEGSEVLFPPEVHDYLFEILSQFDIIRKLNSESYFIPLLLSDTKSFPLSIEKILFSYDDPNNSQLFTSMELDSSSSDLLSSISLGTSSSTTSTLLIKRIFGVSETPIGLMARIQCKLLERFELIYRWRSGCVGKMDNDFCMVEIDYNSDLEMYCIKVQYKCKKSESYFSSIQLLRYVMEVIKSLCTEWYRILNNYQIAIDPKTNSEFRLSMLLDKFAQGIHSVEIDEFQNQMTSLINDEDDSQEGDNETRSSVPIQDLIPEIILTDMPNFRIDPKQLRILKKLGEGYFGIVLKAEFTSSRNQNDSPDIVAVKLLKEDDIEEITNFIQEISLMSNFQHRNLVNLKGFGVGELVIPSSSDISNTSTPTCFSQVGLFAVMEYIEGRNLNEYLHDPECFIEKIKKFYFLTQQLQLARSQKISEHDLSSLEKQYDDFIASLKKFQLVDNVLFDRADTYLTTPNNRTDNEFYEAAESLIRNYSSWLPSLSHEEIYYILMNLACGIQFLHSFDPPVIHRDLKPDNCLVSFKPSVHYPEHAIISGFKICDFGMTTKLYQHRVNDDKFGALAWRAPENLPKSKTDNDETQPSLHNDHHATYSSTAADIYSLGIMIWELLHRNSLPYDDVEKETFQVFENVEVITIVKKGIRPTISDAHEKSDDPFIKALLKLMKMCWSTSPFDRPSIYDVIVQLSYLRKFFEFKFYDETDFQDMEDIINDDEDWIDETQTIATSEDSLTGSSSSDKYGDYSDESVQWERSSLEGSQHNNLQLINAISTHELNDTKNNRFVSTNNNNSHSATSLHKSKVVQGNLRSTAKKLLYSSVPALSPSEPISSYIYASSPTTNTSSSTSNREVLCRIKRDMKFDFEIKAVHFCINDDHSVKNLSFNKMFVAGNYNNFQLISIADNDFPIDTRSLSIYDSNDQLLSKNNNNSPNPNNNTTTKLHNKPKLSDPNSTASGSCNYEMIISNPHDDHQLFAVINSSSLHQPLIQVLQLVNKISHSSSISGYLEIVNIRKHSIFQFKKIYFCSIVEEEKKTFLICVRSDKPNRPPLRLLISISAQNPAIIPSSSSYKPSTPNNSNSNNNKNNNNNSNNNEDDDTSFILRSSDPPYLYKMKVISGNLSIEQKVQKRNRWVEEICTSSTGRLTQSLQLKHTISRHEYLKIHDMICDDLNRLWIFVNIRNNQNEKMTSDNEISVVEIWEINQMNLIHGSRQNLRIYQLPTPKFLFRIPLSQFSYSFTYLPHFSRQSNVFFDFLEHKYGNLLKGDDDRNEENGYDDIGDNNAKQSIHHHRQLKLNFSYDRISAVYNKNDRKMIITTQKQKISCLFIISTDHLKATTLPFYVFSFLSEIVYFNILHRGQEKTLSLTSTNSDGEKVFDSNHEVLLISKDFQFYYIFFKVLENVQSEISHTSIGVTVLSPTICKSPSKNTDSSSINIHHDNNNNNCSTPDISSAVLLSSQFTPIIIVCLSSGELLYANFSFQSCQLKFQSFPRHHHCKKENKNNNKDSQISSKLLANGNVVWHFTVPRQNPSISADSPTLIYLWTVDLKK